MLNIEAGHFCALSACIGEQVTHGGGNERACDAWGLTNEAWSWQVVGLRNGWQTALVMAGLTTKIHGKRLAQGTEVLLELRAGGAISTLQWSLDHANFNTFFARRSVSCHIFLMIVGYQLLYNGLDEHGAASVCGCRCDQRGYVRDAHAAGRRALAADHPCRRQGTPQGAACVQLTLSPSLACSSGALAFVLPRQRNRLHC